MSAKKTQNNIPWVEKYRPQSLKEMEGFEEVAQKLVKFVKNFYKYKDMRKKLKRQLNSEQDPRKKKRLELKYKSLRSKIQRNKARLMIGPPGVGKTTIAYALANDFGLSVIELNASDSRTKGALKEKLSETVQSTNLLSFTQKKTKGKLILIDEVDGLHGNKDRGGISMLQEIISFSKHPVLMTCNFKDRKFKKLYDIARPLIHVKLAQPKDVAAILQKIASKENIEISIDQIKSLAKRSNGDYRSAINDLQALSQGTKKITDAALENINMNRDSEENIYMAFFKMFETVTIREAKSVIDKISQRDADFRNIHRWIHENVFKFFNRDWDIYYAYENLAFVDRILGYLLRTQDYKHLAYFYDILAGGIRFSKTDKRVSRSKLNYPRWFRTSAPADDKYAKTLQDLFRVSLNKVMKEIKPNLRIYSKVKPEIEDYLNKVFKLTQSTEKKNKRKLQKILK